MNTDLTGHPLPVEGFPLSQPYTLSPWNYAGTESVTNLPPKIVDWVLVEFRDAADAVSATEATIVETQVGFLNSKGNIVGLDGYSNLQLSATISQNLYVVICHRNHIDIMSANALTQNGSLYSYDFTTSETKVYGGPFGHKEIAPGIWGMISGNGIADLNINDSDINNSWFIQAGLSEYLSGDFNLDCQVDNKDKDEFWLPNNGKGCQVP